MPTLHNDFADFLKLLNERNVRYLVVGGYAVADLIKNKVSTGRGKDRVDAEALQKRTTP